MFLVQEKRLDGKWEVPWLWFPSFLAVDVDLHHHVDAGMTKMFKGEIIPEEEAQKGLVLNKMSQEVIRLILEKYTIKGLKKYLEAIQDLEPEKEA